MSSPQEEPELANVVLPQKKSSKYKTKKKAKASQLVFPEPEKSTSIEEPKDSPPLPMLTCTDCGFQSKHKPAFTSHMRRIHNINFGNTDEQTCENCGKTFVNQDGLKRHIERIHEGKRKTHTCEICQKDFHTKKMLSFHTKGVHEGQEVYTRSDPCEYCGKTFQEFKNYPAYNLFKHVRRIHTEEKKSRGCTICGKAFFDIAHLNIHIKKVHEKFRDENERRTCDQCGKVFSTLVTVQKHIREVHNKEKNQSCYICGRAFFSKSHVNRHLKTIHGK